MPYIWGVGLIYFGMNDQMLGMFIWCMFSVVYVWFKIRVLPEVMRLIEIVWDMYMVVLGLKKQTEEMNEMVEMMTVHLMMANKLEKDFA